MLFISLDIPDMPGLAQPATLEMIASSNRSLRMIVSFLPRVTTEKDGKRQFASTAETRLEKEPGAAVISLAVENHAALPTVY